ncbi:PTS lactose/cellobiose transporter subunit IIA [Ectobacillus ponti]|uniref:PTS lactose/cellobiose transporter subunit IIA n=1 Tax=Ectobacillus ponti TaxID=2961894 RepID=A0AA41XCG6_9BACI|nr:PTS lactose/cellobiose transporter subunit IIA [Ectobacillus ponti]MCP8969526.1 PTS lactose/cellobiose transporter subunit IIA [Ectobacillus ponti]
MENVEQLVFQIILHGGNGRSSAMEAMAAARAGDFMLAQEKLQQAARDLGEAHTIQTQLIQGEIRGEKSEISLLMVHAQDHLMNAMTVKELAAEIVALHERLGAEKLVRE